jgi:hypothetical protein
LVHRYERQTPTQGSMMVAATLGLAAIAFLVGWYLWRGE